MRTIFQAGGAVSPDHPTYVERSADYNALRSALNSEYLHIIAPRQIGKTSLIKRLAHKLNMMGWRCAYVDLSMLMDLPKPIWYAELGKELASALTPNYIPGLANQIDLRRYLLNDALPWTESQPRIALFFDEVEGAGKARSDEGTPFSDTFFMTLRNLYIQKGDYEGILVVVLSGAINPNKLVRDPDISPFNVGVEVDLSDFTPEETMKLTNHLTQLGLPVDDSAHQAIYNWTNGHPYLTQRICIELEKAVSNLVAITATQVDHVVEHILLDPPNPTQKDKNLRHVAKMLNSLSGHAKHLWSRLKAGESIPFVEVSDDLYLELYLTGAVKLHEGHLVIRNRIYERAFADQAIPRQIASVNLQSRSGAVSEPIRVFISSTWIDLQPEREAVEKALHRMRNTSFSGMEYFGSRPRNTKGG